MNISDLLKDPSKLNETFEKTLNEKDKETADLLVPYIKEPYLIYRYAKEIVGGKVSDELEEVIAQSEEDSLSYVKEVIRDRFRKYEEKLVPDKSEFFSYIRALNSISPNKLLEFLNEKGISIENTLALLSAYEHYDDDENPYKNPELKKMIEEIILKSDDPLLKISYIFLTYYYDVTPSPQIIEDVISRLDTLEPYYIGLLPDIPEIRDKVLDYLFNRSPQEIAQKIKEYELEDYLTYVIYRKIDKNMLLEKYPSLVKALKLSGISKDEFLKLKITHDIANDYYYFFSDLRKKYWP
ncbi:MAG: hypothetical protein QXL51_00640 [Candidatus Aenigmatarchaeota archaeon]